MIRMLLQAAINVAMASLGLLLAQTLVDGVTLQASGFITAVLVFVLAQAVLGPFVFNMARQYASAILGGVGLISTFLALWIATLVPDGLTISGVTAWVFAPLLVWIVTALGTWILGYLVLKRWWDKRKEEKNIRQAIA
ncbi:phage holin family protein [Nesterenkonia sandarakina]